LCPTAAFRRLNEKMARRHGSMQIEAGMSTSTRPLHRQPVRTIGLIGFGGFARLVHRHLSRHFEVAAYDPDPARRVDGVASAEVALAASREIVVLAVPVDQIATAVAAIRDHLRPGAIVLDVCSIKAGPVAAMVAGLPPDVEIIGTHPLFGPQSAKEGLAGLKIAVCPVRGKSARRIAAFLRRTLGLGVLFITPDDHDREAAMVQGLTHLIARVLVQMEPLPRQITTPSFDHLMKAVDLVRHDPDSVFSAIVRDNPHVGPVREQFTRLLTAIAVRPEIGPCPRVHRINSERDGSLWKVG
jgi:prephenate dehydrogenase